MKYFLGIFGVILLIIFVFVLIFRGGNSGDVPANEVRALAEYASEPQSIAVFTHSGAITNQEEHRTIRITVTDSVRSAAIVKGYNGDVLKRKTFPNTTAAFEAFLAGIEQAGFTKDRRTRLSFESVCPGGQRFSYKLRSDEEKIVDTWSANCERGSYGGDRSLTRNLFEAQIPEYNDFAGDVSFSL